jgi:hypothetical protein
MGRQTACQADFKEMQATVRVGFMTQVSLDGRARCFLSGRAFSHASDSGSEAALVASCVGIFVKQLHPDPVSLVGKTIPGQCKVSNAVSLSVLVATLTDLQEVLAPS